jgi:hypothetical protein
MSGDSTQPGGSWSEFVSSRGRAPQPAADPEETMYLPPISRSAQPQSLPHRQPPPRPHALIGRFAVSLAGLLAAGCFVLGWALVVLMIVAPRTGGTGLEVATGPGWTRTIWHLLVGGAGEAGLQFARKQSWPIRVIVATCVIVAVLATLALAWWS